MRTNDHILEINAPEEMHKLCQFIIGKFVIATIGHKDEPPLLKKNFKVEERIRGHILRLQYTVEESRYHLTRFNLSLKDEVGKAKLSLIQDVEYNIIPKEALSLTYVPTIIDHSYGRNPVFFEMDATISSLFRIGDRLQRLINAIKPLRGVKSDSLNDFVESLKIQRIEEFDNIIIIYWEKVGKKIRDYRDMIEHNQHVKRDFRYIICVSPYGESVPLLILPDNPEDKSLDKLQYNNEINAYEYLNDAYDQTIECIEEVLTHLKPLAILKAQKLIDSIKH
jgi:hypothetical protein